MIVSARNDYQHCRPNTVLQKSALAKSFEGVVAQWCNPRTLQSEQSGGVGLIPGRAQQLERHDKGSWTRLALSYFCDPSAWR